MKNILIICLVLVSTLTFAQNKIASTNTLRIYGKVKQEHTLTLSAFDTLKKTDLAAVKMLDSKGALKEEAQNVKGVLLKDVFSGIIFDVENHKAQNRIYFVLTATDGFKMVLSFNEVFHPTSCTNFYLITDTKGVSLKDMTDRLKIVEISDAKTGHKRIEGLESIQVAVAM